MKRTKLIGILVIALFVVFSTIVSAANDSYQTTLKANASEVKVGENITITIGLDKIAITTGDKGIGAYTAKLEYDTSALEYVETQGSSKWGEPFFKNGSITGVTKDGECVNTTQSIGTITFKVKDNAKLGKTTIQLTNFKGSTGVAGDLMASNQPKIEITVVSKQSDNQQNGDNDQQGGNNNNQQGNNNNQQNNNNNQQGNNNNQQNNNNTQQGNNNQQASNNNGGSSVNNSNSNNNSQNKGQTSEIKDNTIATGKIPQTGNDNSFILLGIAIAIGVALVSLIYYKKARR